MLLLLACAEPVPAEGTDSAASRAWPTPEEALTAEAIEAATARMTDLGPRQVATEAEARAAAVVEEAFLDAGLQDVAAEPFTFDAWLPGEATLTLAGDVIVVEALSPSPATELSARLADDAADASGAVLLRSSDEGSRAESFLDATMSGAVAMVRVTEDTDRDGAPLVEVGHTLQGTSFPSVAVDRPTGDRLRAAVGETVGVRIAPTWVNGHTSVNVVGRVPGAGARRVFVVAHYDSWHPSESAFDNALGVGALLQMAKAAAGTAPEAEIVFLATSAEEQGLQGAMAWVDAHGAEVGPGDVVITLDVLWSAEGTFVVMASDDDTRALAMSAAEAEGLDPYDGGDPGVASDHFPFVLEGADAVWCGRWPDRHYHTTGDVREELDFAQAAAAARSQWAVLAAVAGVPAR